VPSRDPELQAFVDVLVAAVAAAAVPGSPMAVAADHVFDRLAGRAGEAGEVAPKPLDVCRLLPTARANAEAAAPEVGAVARAFAALEGRLAWYARPSDDVDFRDGHANTFVIGEAGLEDHPGVVIGATLMAPGLTYPDHDHPPEEVYLVLGAGEWWNTETPWHEPGPGGLVHNPPGILHAMRSGDDPLLAIWCMLT